MYFWFNGKLNFKTDSILIFFTLKYLLYQDILITTKLLELTKPGLKVISFKFAR